MRAGERINYDELEMYLRALANSQRLELVDILRVPTALTGIDLSPGKVRPGEKPDRPMSRQAIMEHLDKLTETGIVVANEPPETDPKAKRAREYVVNPRRIYQITEEFRRLSTITVGAPGTGAEATVNVREERRGDEPPGPKLVLVHGATEGKAYPLRAEDLAEGRGWLIGRRPGAHVNLAYDPYVSLENSELLLEDGRHVLADLRTSKNGTSLNWRRLGKDERAALRPGDVVGVGRSLLVFRVE